MKTGINGSVLRCAKGERLKNEAPIYIGVCSGV